MITNDAVVFGILISIISLVFITSNSQNKICKKFYKFVPSLLLCYFVPSIFNTLGIISGELSNLYFVASRYLLPASLVLLTISIDLPQILKLGPKALIMFLTGTFGIIFGGPISILLVSYIAPSMLNGADSDLIWRGFTTVAGSWIGGGANQAAMKEIFEVDDTIFSTMIAVDVIVANIWMAFLLYGAGIHSKVDKVLKADSSAIEELKMKIEKYKSQINKIPDLVDTIKIMGVGFGVTAISHFGSDFITPHIKNNYSYLEKFSLTSGFFWLIVLSTTLALCLSFTKVRQLEGAGASRYGSLFLFASYYTLIREGHVRIDVLYANLSKKNKAKVNLFGSLILGIPLCLTIFFRGMSCKQCVLNQPIMNFETSQSTQGMNIKYLMAGFLIIFALTMLIQFTVYILRSYKIIKES